MCGITAFSLAEESSIPDLRSFTRCAVMAIEHRGTDATGFGWTRPDGLGRYWKEPITAYRATVKAPLPREATVMLGHTRWGTSGPKSIPSNNHPVIDEGIMLVHNGVVNNEFAIYKMFDLPTPKQTVDTAALAMLLANVHQLGKEHPVDVLSIPTGSAAIAWIDTAEPHALQMARLQDRPLTLAWTRKGDCIMSSTLDTLEHLSLLSNIKFRKITEIKEGSYIKVERGDIVEVRSFEPRTYATGWSGSGSSYVSKDNGKTLELVKGGKDDGEEETILFELTTEELDDYGICRWDIEDIEVPKDVPFTPKAIRDWRFDCKCADCLTYEERKEEWAAADDAARAGLDEYVYRGQRMVWNREAGNYIPADDDAIEIDDNDPALILE